MKTTINILRGIITSLLFLILIAVVIIQFAFTTIRLSNKNLPDLIDRETILKLALPESESLDKETKSIATEYIDDYINYVFHKRSFPSVQNIDKTNLTEEDIKSIEKLLTTLRGKIDMDYESVLLLRDINNFLSNGSIYLLINIGLLINILLILITTGRISKTFILSGLAVTVAGIIILITCSILPSLLLKLLDPLALNFVKDILNTEFISKIFNQSLIYISIGFVLFIITFIIQKLIFKKQIQN